jgi:prevent-host-death family protein
MDTVNIHQAKTQLSKLVERVEAGEEVVISRAGKPVAQLVPYVPKVKRRLGVLKGKIRIGVDFDAPLPDEMLSLFEGSESSAKRRSKR